MFNFDVPWALQGKKCSLTFLLPQLKQLQTSNYWLSGHGGVRVAQLESYAVQGTTYANKGNVKKDFGVTNLAPGNAYAVTTFDCPAGDRLGFLMSPESDTCLNYFQDYNPCRKSSVISILGNVLMSSAIGLYITAA